MIVIVYLFTYYIPVVPHHTQHNTKLVYHYTITVVLLYIYIPSLDSPREAEAKGEEKGKALIGSVFFYSLLILWVGSTIMTCVVVLGSVMCC